MSGLNFKTLVISALLILFFSESKAQKASIFIPDQALLQHAGSIGFMSGGIGYDLFKTKRGSLDFIYGYLPESKGGSFSTGTVKFAYRIWEIKRNKKFTFYPIYPGTFISYTIDKNFDLTWDKGQYPKGYYYWSEALRFHALIGSELKYNLSTEDEHRKIKSLSLFYEINTNDVYLINYYLNKRYLNITGIFKAGIGVRAHF